MDNLWTTRRSPVQVIHILAMYLTRRLLCAGQRAAGRCSSRPISRDRAGLCLIAALLCLSTVPANASTMDHYKLYAHSRIIEWNEFMCFKDIITKENRQWDVKAKNGSHYGLGQMRSKWYRNLDGYRQIDATIKYITNRYQTPCKAWAFHQKESHY